MFAGLINSVTVSVAIRPTIPTSTITLSAVYRLQLIPIFDRFGLLLCDTPLSVPTANGFYTSKLSLRCCHNSGESDIVLGSDWISACGAVLCNDGSELADPPRPTIASLPPGYYWNRSEGEVVVSFAMTTR